jgi:ribonuclease P protein subunit RPR2
LSQTDALVLELEENYIMQRRLSNAEATEPLNRHVRTRKRNKEIASERMDILLDISLKTLRTDRTRSQHYFQLARRLGMKYKIRLSPQFRRLICRRCKSLSIPGVNARVRLQQRRESHMVVTCFECGAQRRMPLGGHR